MHGGGSFIISIVENKQNKTGWRVELCIAISLHKRDQIISTKIQELLQVGKISLHGSESIQWRVRNLIDIEKLIDYFDRYSLITQKCADFLFFKKVFYLMKNKEHLTFDGLKQIVEIKASQNFGLSNKLQEAYPFVDPVKRPLVLNKKSKILFD